MSGKADPLNYIITDVLTVNLDGDLCVDPPEEYQDSNCNPL